MRSLRYCLIWLAALLLAPTLANADENWQSISQQARGQTVWFNAWGGDPAVNRYLDWVSAEVKRDYAVDLRIVHIADAADAVEAYSDRGACRALPAAVQSIYCGLMARISAR